MKPGTIVKVKKNSLLYKYLTAKIGSEYTVVRSSNALRVYGLDAGENIAIQVLPGQGNGTTPASDTWFIEKFHVTEVRGDKKEIISILSL